jgi:hypothetical protein
MRLVQNEPTALDGLQAILYSFAPRRQELLVCHLYSCFLLVYLECRAPYLLHANVGAPHAQCISRSFVQHAFHASSQGHWCKLADTVISPVVQRGHVFTRRPSRRNPYVLQFARYYTSILSPHHKSGKGEENTWIVKETLWFH